jgi:hypothetical protein
MVQLLCYDLAMDEITTALRGDDLIAEYKRRFGDTTLLGFSRGKDSIATVLALRGKLNLVPIHLDIVPGLEFIDESLAYYEKHLFDGQHIIRMPHPSLYRMLNNNLYQTIGNAEVMASANLEELDYVDINRLALQQVACEQKIVLSAAGVRAADSPMRRTAVARHGSIHVNTRVWWPIWDWNKAKLVEEISRVKISLPVDYLLWGRSFDGIDARFIIPMKQHMPSDYKRVLEWYPLLEAEIMRYEMHQRKSA